MGAGLPLVEVDIGLAAHDACVAATNTLDLGQGEHDLCKKWGVPAQFSVCQARCCF